MNAIDPVSIQRELTIELQRVHGLEATLHACLDACTRCAGMDSGGVYLRDDRREVMKLVMHRGVEDKFIDIVAEVPLDMPEVLMALEGKPLYKRIPHLDATMKDAYLEEGLKIVAIIPIRHENRTIGCMNIASHSIEDIDRETRLMLESLGGIIGQAVVAAGSREAFVEEEARLNSLFRVAPVGIGLTNKERRLLEVNDRLCQMLGRDRKELMGCNTLLLYPDEEEYERVGEVMKNLLAVNDTGEIETRFATTYGEPIDVLLSVTYIEPRNPDRGITFTALDITRFKKTEQALRESATRYKLVVDNSLQAVVVAQYGKVVFANKALEKLVHRQLNEITNVPFLTMIHPDDRELVRTQHEKRMKGIPLSEPYDFRIVDVYDRVRWLRTSSVCIDWDGEPASLLFISDITERKEAEQALRESEQRYRSIFDGACEGILIADAETKKLLFANRAGLDLFGYDAGTFKKLSVLDLYPPGHVEKALRLFESHNQGDHNAVITDLMCRRSDGSVFTASVSTTTMVLDKRLCVVGFFTDLTQQFQLEEQLRQAQKMEAVGRLAGGLAHDYNNILAAIIGYCHLLNRSLRPDDPAYSDVQDIAGCARRAAKLTSQLLAFSRNQPRSPLKVDLNEILTNLERMLGRLLGEDINLVLEKCDCPAIVEVDPNHIEQVIMNLAVNARDAMPTGGRFTISVGRVSLKPGTPFASLEAGEYISLNVCDNGSGMDEETRSMAFEPFFTTKPSEKGTGLGLSTVYGIVKQNNGDIRIRSEPGKGTTFEILLPLVEGAPDCLPMHREEKTASLDGTETILVVEDDQYLRVLTCRILSERGYHVLEAANAGEALLICEQHQGTIDLLLSDVVMPRMNGLRMVDRLKNIRGDIKVLYVSGYPMGALNERQALPPGTPLLQKPYTPIGLLKRVRAMLDEKDE